MLGKQFRSGTAAVAEPLLEVAETGGVEQTLEQPAALFAVRAQEPGEVALWKEYHLEELFGAHPEQRLDDVADLLGARQVLPRPVEPREIRLGILFDRAGAALLRAFELGAAFDGQAATRDGRLEPDRRHGTHRAWSDSNRRPSERAPGTVP